MREEAWKLAQLSLGLWLLPWAPVAAIVCVAWVTGWEPPGVVASVFSLGWPIVYYLWIREGEGAVDENPR